MAKEGIDMIQSLARPLNKYKFIVALSLILVAIGTRPVLAQTSEQESHSNHETDHEAKHDFHPNLLAFFIGGTSEERREKSFALGIEYERRLS